MLATGSMDNTSRLWDVETGECLHTLLGHTAEIVSLDFDTQGQRIITGSFDNTVKVWDVRTGRCIHTLTGHQGEISSCQFNYASDLCISGSIDRTCKVWDMASGTCVHTLRGHNDEILDVTFNTTGELLLLRFMRLLFYMQRSCIVLCLYSPSCPFLLAAVLPLSGSLNVIR